MAINVQWGIMGISLGYIYGNIITIGIHISMLSINIHISLGYPLGINMGYDFMDIYGNI